MIASDAPLKNLRRLSELPRPPLSLVAGGFTYAWVDVNLSGPNVSELRCDSHLRFETEDEAYEGGSAHARRQVAKMGR